MSQWETMRTCINFLPWHRTSSHPHHWPSQMENSVREVEQQCPLGKIFIKSVTLLLLNAVKMYCFLPNFTHKVIKRTKQKNITFFRNSLQTTSLVTWNSAEGILLIFNLDFLRYSNVCKTNKKTREFFAKTMIPVYVFDSTRPDKMQHSLVVQFGFELCLLASLHAKAVGWQGRTHQ